MMDFLPAELPWPHKTGTRTAAGPVAGCAAAALIASAASGRAGLRLVLTADPAAAQALLRELEFFCPTGLALLGFPDWETLPYDNFSPHQDIISERLRTLALLPGLRSGILVVPVTSLMHRLPPPSFVRAHLLSLKPGMRLDVAQLRRDLEASGYHATDTVYERGEFAVRGALLDIYPMGAELPLRVDLLDDEVDSLRTFDPETQRTVARIEGIELLPAREFPVDAAGIALFSRHWHETFDVDHDACPMYRDLRSGAIPNGSEYYLPLFFERCALLLDYLPADAALITLGDHHGAAEHFWQDVTSRYREYGVDPTRPLLPPERGFVPVPELYQALGHFSVLELRQHSDAPVHVTLPFLPPPALADEPGASAAERLAGFVERHGGPILLCAESAGRREILLETLQAIGLRPEFTDNWDSFLASGSHFALCTAPLDQGLYLGPGHACLLSEAQLFGRRVAQRRRRDSKSGDVAVAFRDINELRPGVAVVHMEHGVGRYTGLQNLAVDGQVTEFLTLEYAEGARLYVPVASLHLISRYEGNDPDAAPLHRLGSDQWEKARRKAAEKVRDVAAELLEVYARREARVGFRFELDAARYQIFADEFPFEETPDQRTAIAAVLADMCSDKVMDRLVCGDVGFGKTEVAMRAAFAAVMNGKQVAVLVPTTLLAQQHHSSFSDRFAGWPVQVGVVSRFQNTAETRELLHRLREGKLDILIGTHKLLSKDVQFADLGLLIVDEEHRFGVRQKDQIKALRAQVDILTLTATPIPRTLNMALGGMRDLSVIATPPARRLSIKTFVREHNKGLMKEAIQREILRGGQIFFLHNEVRSIERAAEQLRELLPDLRVGIAHGQMRESELEKVMSAFYHHRYDVLVCSTIIETGIDIPNANTIIIERADKFGLAQLHQLRGRVGRSHHQAYAYLMCPPRTHLTADAEKRLEAIEAAGDLGAGYLLATHDLEIRGAGELLGDEQSGQIQSVGFGLYMKMLERAVAALRRGELPDIDAAPTAGCEVNLHLPALIPESYLPDINARLVLYKRIAAAAGDGELRELQVEMIDRFGLLPDPVRNLFAATSLRLLATNLGVRKITADASGGTLDFAADTRIDPLQLVKLVQGDPQRYRLGGSSKLRFVHGTTTAEQRTEMLRGLLERLAPKLQDVAA